MAGTDRFPASAPERAPDGTARVPAGAMPTAPPQGWTPPPKPGLIPLRPMTLGTILAASFQVMRRNPRTTLVPALVLALLIAIATAGGVGILVASISRISTTTSTTDQGALAAGSFLVAALVGVVALALVVVGTAMLQALIVTEIASGTVGQKLSLGEAWGRARGRFGAVLGFGALLIVAIVVAVLIVFGLLAAVTAGIASSGSSTSSNIGATIALVFGVRRSSFSVAERCGRGWARNSRSCRRQSCWSDCRSSRRSSVRGD